MGRAIGDGGLPLVGLLPTPRLVGFYQRHGYTPRKSDGPAMLKWVNPQTEV
jgi:hypothetical protein